jgi:hypothetical protein
LKTVATTCLVIAGFMAVFMITPVPRSATAKEAVARSLLNVATYLLGVASLLSAFWVWTL